MLVVVLFLDLAYRERWQAPRGSLILRSLLWWRLLPHPLQLQTWRPRAAHHIHLVGEMKAQCKLALHVCWIICVNQHDSQAAVQGMHKITPPHPHRVCFTVSGRGWSALRMSLEPRPFSQWSSIRQWEDPQCRLELDADSPLCLIQMQPA